MHIVFFDIDQTLAVGKIIPESAKKAIKILRSQGDLVFICTGRNINYVKKNFSQYADGFITNNGRLACYKDQIIFSSPIDKETVTLLLRRLKDLDAGCVFHTLNRGHYDGPEDLYEPIKAVGDPGYLTKGIDGKEDYYNFDISFYDEDHRNAIKEALKEVPEGTEGAVSFAGSWYTLPDGTEKRAHAEGGLLTVGRDETVALLAGFAWEE